MSGSKALGGARVSHEAWLERKDRQRREEMSRDAAAKKRSAQDKENSRTGKASLKFSKWLAIKDKYERAVSLLAQVDADKRITSPEKWREMGVAMCAADCALILLHRADKTGGDRYSKLKKLGQLWLDWTMKKKGHEFTDVRLEKKDWSRFPEDGADFENLSRETAPDGSRTFALLRYMDPFKKAEGGDAPKPGEAPKGRQLSETDVFKNALYKRKLQEALEDAQKEVVRQLLRAREQWLKEADDAVGHGTVATAHTAKQEQTFLHRIGIGFLRECVEIDEDERAQLEQQDKRRKQDEAENQHMRWVAKMGKMRLKLPPEKEGVKFGGKWQPPRFDFGRGKPLVRADKMKLPQTSVDWLKGGGSRYIHARSADEVEKCRAQLVRKGYVHPENFDHDQDERNRSEHFPAEKQAFFRKQVAENPDSKRRRQEQRAKHASSQFEDWLSQKELVERSLACMPGIAVPDRGVGNEERKRWLEVGRALKMVDAVVLFQAWADWSAGYKPGGTCRMYWESFPPIGCAVCTAGPIRDLLLKFLSRPGMNYKKAFLEVVLRKWRRFAARSGDAKVAELEEDRSEAEDLGKTWEPPREYDSVYSLSTGEVGGVVKGLGFVLTPEELTRLVNTFDLDGDGTVHMDEFLSFTGSKRSKASGDAAAQLRDVCSWETVCHKTGMANAYQIVVETKQMEVGGRIKECKQVKRVQLRDHKARLRIPFFAKIFGDEPPILDMQELRAATRSGLTDAEITQVRTGSGGEVLYTVRFADDIEPAEVAGLRAAQLAHPDGPSAFTRGAKVRARLLSEAASWGSEQRRQGLAVLQAKSERYRQDQRLRQTVSAGSPPEAPQLIVAPFKSEAAAHYKQQGGTFDSTTEMLLRWSPGSGGGSGSVPSFFVLECCAKKSGAPDGEWQELVRDPEDFKSNNGQPKYVVRNDPTQAAIMEKMGGGGGGGGGGAWFKAEGLEPNTAYAFRLRAFNGFGASPPTRRVMTTYPSQPIKPAKVWAREDKICLSWGDSGGAAKRVAELEKLFDECDRNGDGNVSRDELLDALEERPPLLAFVRKVKVGVGSDGTASASLLAAVEKVSVFDMIEMNDDDVIDKAEFVAYFESALVREEEEAMAAAAAGKGGAEGSGTAVGTKYALLQCQSDSANEYVIVYRGAQTRFVVCDLAPGNSYQFRVQAQNESQHNDETPDAKDGGETETQKSKVSKPTLVQTMLTTPPAPALMGPPSCTNATLRWERGAAHKQTDKSGGQETKKGGREKDKVERLLTEWTRADEDADGGINLERKFSEFLQKYDEDGSGTLDKEEFRCLLEGMGVDANPTRVDEAFELVDDTGDGQIGYDEFCKWWRNSDLGYVLKMDMGTGEDEIAGRVPEGGDVRALAEGAVMKRSVYKGGSATYMVHGLVPNMLYHFRLRYTSSTSASALSAPLQLMTAPDAPPKPVVVSCGRQFVRLKTHRPASGAHRIQVEFKTYERIGMGGGSGDAEAALPPSKCGWRRMYDGPNSYVTITGQECPKSELPQRKGRVDHMLSDAEKEALLMSERLLTGLEPSTHYRVRARCVNRLGVPGEWSEVAAATTLGRTERDDDLRPANALSKFTLMCGDHNDPVVVGDTILFSERLFKDPRSGMLLTSSRAARRAVSGSASASKMGSMSSASSLRHSVSAAAAMGGGGGAGADSAPVSLGERTIAARVVSESWTSAKLRQKQRHGDALPPGMGNRPGKGLQRELRLDVVWCTVQNRPAANAYIEPKDKLITRMWNQLTEFEILRTPWECEALAGGQPGGGSRLSEEERLRAFGSDSYASY